MVVIGVNTWEKSATAGPEYIKKQGYTYLNLLKGDDLAKAYGISGIPTMIQGILLFCVICSDILVRFRVRVARR